MSERRGVRSFVTDRYYEDGSAERGGVPVEGTFWRVLRGGREYAADFETAAEARKMKDDLNARERAFWARTPEERRAIVEDADHEDHALAVFLGELFG